MCGMSNNANGEKKQEVVYGGVHVLGAEKIVFILAKTYEIPLLRTNLYVILVPLSSTKNHGHMLSKTSTSKRCPLKKPDMKLIRHTCLT